MLAVKIFTLRWWNGKSTKKLSTTGDNMINYNRCTKLESVEHSMCFILGSLISTNTAYDD